MREGPAWFVEAIGRRPDRQNIMVEGAAIECLSWGQRGRPAILFLHGTRANADWWSHIAPLLADRYRVSALSFSGCGRSDWRDRYSNDLHVAEVLQTLAALGLDEGVELVLAGHSYGARIAALAAKRLGERLAGVVVIDATLAAQPRVPGTKFVSALPRSPGSIDEALARFRLVPSGADALPCVIDHIARASLRRKELDQNDTWNWAADPRSSLESANSAVWQSFVDAKRPFAFIYGGRSPIVTPEAVDLQKNVAPNGSMFLPIADAGHNLMIDQPLALLSALRTAAAAFIERYAAGVSRHGAKA